MCCVYYVIGISLTDKSEFSEKWAEALTSKGVSDTDSFYLKHVIEIVKLKVIHYWGIIFYINE